MKMYRIIGNEGRVTIPWTLRACIGFETNDVVSFEMVSDDAVLVRREQLKDRSAPKQEMPSLKELLESLTEEQRNAAQCYLSILCSADGTHSRKDLR